MANLRHSKRLNACIVAGFVDKFTSCSLSNQQVANKVREVQIHKHTRTCYKKGGTCWFNFPKYPSEETIVAQPLEREQFSSDTEYDVTKEHHQNTLNIVKCALN